MNARRTAYRARLGSYAILFLAAVAYLGAQWGAFEPALTWYHRATPRAASVVFIVLDTVRADRLSLCGYERPTAPTLEALAERGASWTCNAVAPGSWTVPSHASYFTGLDVPAHGAHFADGGTEIRGMTIRPLPESLSTLAEQMADAGYQTTGVSGNPVLVPASGLTRGFESWRVARTFRRWSGAALVEEVRGALRELERDGPPLFLFVNIADAHDPWEPVPDELAWIPPRDEGLGYFLGPEPGEWESYVTDQMAAPEAAGFRARLGDLYDYAVYRADHTLSQVLEAIESHGWASAGMRLVIVSDHGEFLGEHGLARHGRYLWQPNNRVPLVVFDTERDVELPDSISALNVFSLVRDGLLPEALDHPHAVAFPDEFWLARSRGRVGGSLSAAVWNGSDKLVWMDGEISRYDLENDPEELEPLAAAATPLLPELEALVTRVRAAGRRGGEFDPAMLEALRAAGYVQ